MQIKHATAREMGYRGDARGLLDPQTNLTYAVPYLANAYRLADGNEDRAASLFRSGYYAVAKRKKMQGLLRTASSPALTPGTRVGIRARAAAQSDHGTFLDPCRIVGRGGA
jgi:soluble lytic murein transglycosylase-like protein